MGLPEIAYRLRNRLQASVEALGLGLARLPPHPVGKPGSVWLAEMPVQFAREPYLASAERVLSGSFDIFSCHGLTLGFPPDWNRDPKTGAVAPMRFGKTLEYRDERVVGDIKYLWEPNRHLELVTLAQAWHLSGDRKFATGCRDMLLSWFEQCIYPLGPNWVSSLEHAVRLLNWSYAWHLLGGDASNLFEGEDGKQFKREWLASIYRHLHFIQGHFSRYSSANNHLLGEYMGLFVGALTWPCWPECDRWRVLAQDGFVSEALRQNYPDGVNREQAIWYHHEVADMMLHCGLIGRANGVEFEKLYWSRLESMMEFIASIMDVNGHVPMLGDSDDALMVRFSQEPEFDAYRSLLATGAVLFDRGDFKAKAGRFDDKSRWMLGDAAAEQYESIRVEDVVLPVRREFPHGGYWLLGDAFETSQEVRMLVDAGQLGYLSIAAHGHADALAFTLSIGGSEILIDPGTFAYHTQKIWRDYFRGTSAHNTVRVDGEDQSVIGGNFLWLHHAHAQCEYFSSGPAKDEWQGSHDGYMRLPGSVRHRRKIELDKAAHRIQVVDTLEGKGAHHVEIFWHFAESCVVLKEVDSWHVRCDGGWVEFRFPAALAVRLVHGNEAPVLGWVSRKFDEKQSINVLVCEGNVKAGENLITGIRYSADGGT